MAFPIISRNTCVGNIGRATIKSLQALICNKHGSHPVPTVGVSYLIIGDVLKAGPNSRYGHMAEVTTSLSLVGYGTS